MGDPYTTQLDKSQETAYQLWRKRLSPNLQNEDDYDLRGAFLDNAKEATNGHLPDTFKKPNHITFSDGSKYHSEENPGGQWIKTGRPNRENPKEDEWVFWASPTNLRHHDPNLLENYFRENEKGNAVIFPDPGFLLTP